MPRPIVRPFLAPLLLALLALAAQPARAADAVFPAGSHIGLVPPEGMVASEAFSGFEDRERKSIILIHQVPGAAYDQFLKSMNSGAINIPGVANARREIMLTDGGAAHLVIGDQEAQGSKFRKWLMITRRTVASHETDMSFAFVVTAQVPVEASGIYPDAVIRKALGSVTLRASVPTEEVLRQLPFRMTELANFETVRSILPGRAVMLTERGAKAEPGHPHMMVSISTGAPSQADDRAKFSQDILRSIQGFKNIRLVLSEPQRIGGQPGHEVRLEAQSAADDSEVMIVQWTRFSGNAFLRLIGVAPKEGWLDSFARFRAVRDGIDTR